VLVQIGVAGLKGCGPLLGSFCHMYGPPLWIAHILTYSCRVCNPWRGMRKIFSQAEPPAFFFDDVLVFGPLSVL